METTDVFENVENQEQEKTEEVPDFEVKKYLNENGLIQKWETTGLFEAVTTNAEKYLIASVMEAMIYKSFDMQLNDGKTSEEVLKFHDQYIAKMASLGVFNGNLFKEILEQKPE